MQNGSHRLSLTETPVSSAGVVQGFTYSFKASGINPGLVVTCNTLLNTCTTS